jgi:hypothetical protein
VRRLLGPILLLVLGVASVLVFAASLLTDQWLQSGSPVVEGTIGEELTFDAEKRRYTVRMGRRPGFGEGPTVRVSQAVARGAECLVVKADERQEFLKRETLDDEGGITPLIDTFEAVPGHTRVACRWERGEGWRGELPVFVAEERTFLRHFGYVALVAGLLWIALGGWRLYRAVRRR